MSRFTKKNKFSQPKVNRTPVGDIDGINVDFTLPDDDQYIPGTLEVFLSGQKLCGDQSNPGRDYDENVDMKSFRILVDGESPFGQNVPPCDGEGIEIRYYRKPKC